MTRALFRGLVLSAGQAVRRAIPAVFPVTGTSMPGKVPYEADREIERHFDGKEQAKLDVHNTANIPAVALQHIIDCVPEYYRTWQEERNHLYDLAMQRWTRYLANKEKLDAAARSKLPVLSFGGYGPRWECLNADHDTMTENEDDICLIICHKPSYHGHVIPQTGEESQ